MLDLEPIKTRLANYAGLYTPDRLGADLCLADKCTADVPALVAEVERLRPKAEAHDSTMASCARIEARLTESGHFIPGPDPDEFTCPGCGLTKCGTYCNDCGTRRAAASQSKSDGGADA